MKNKVFLLSCVLILVSGVLFINSCNKIDDAKNADPQSGKDYVTAESTFSDIFKSVTDAIQTKGLKSLKNNDTCPAIKLSSLTTYPDTVTIFFDPIKNCNNDGVTYKGTIIAILSGPFKTPGSVINVSFKDFYVNDNKVEGQKKITNMDRNNAQQLVFKVEITNGLIKTSGGDISFTATKTWTWLEGESTAWPTISDDVWQLEGSAEGTNIDSKHYTVTTLSPLKIVIGCQWKIVGGKIEVKPDSGDTMTIDYGDGITCDNKAILKIGSLADIEIKL
jgi:hypothetical protein